MKQQIWFCQRCEKRGEIQYEEGKDALSVSQRIHRQHRESSPGCEDSSVQVVNNDLITDTELLRVMELEPVDVV